MNARQLYFKKDDTSMLLRKSRDIKYSEYKDEIKKIIIKRITKNSTRCYRLTDEEQKQLLQIVRKEKLEKLKRL
jgi:hypothetical protein